MSRDAKCILRLQLAYVLHSPSLGFTESNIPAFVFNLLSKLQPVDFKACHKLLPALTTFANIPPPAYPYAKATSTYSAVVQLYSQSGQLDTAMSLANCI